MSHSTIAVPVLAIVRIRRAGVTFASYAYGTKSHDVFDRLEMVSLKPSTITAYYADPVVSAAKNRSLNFILDRGDRLKIIRDRQRVCANHISIAMRSALNRIVHEPAHVIQVRLRAGD